MKTFWVVPAGPHTRRKKYIFEVQYRTVFMRYNPVSKFFAISDGSPPRMQRLPLAIEAILEELDLGPYVAKRNLVPALFEIMIGALYCPARNELDFRGGSPDHLLFDEVGLKKTYISTENEVFSTKQRIKVVSNCLRYTEKPNNNRVSHAVQNILTGIYSNFLNLEYIGELLLKRFIISSS
ncbi:hypothetical protein CEXT_440991 [Caerostris extrusa]|uniref:LAGLIDADG homing endonuclease n=1 Tax=Caerostris extrusa TaxID=172846 RepID=A0AAV4Y1H5_CAEEX|nr:hypothetical protein CEXT_440991 [Caerostris extrusa]